MSWYRDSSGTWKSNDYSEWDYTDVGFSPEENERVNAFLDQYESREQRVAAFNGVGKRGLKERHT